MSVENDLELWLEQLLELVVELVFELIHELWKYLECIRWFWVQRRCLGLVTFKIQLD